MSIFDFNEDKRAIVDGLLVDTTTGEILDYDEIGYSLFAKKYPDVIEKKEGYKKGRFSCLFRWKPAIWSKCHYGDCACEKNGRLPKRPYPRGFPTADQPRPCMHKPNQGEPLTLSDVEMVLDVITQRCSKDGYLVTPYPTPMYWDALAEYHIKFYFLDWILRGFYTPKFKYYHPLSWLLGERIKKQCIHSFNSETLDYIRLLASRCASRINQKQKTIIGKLSDWAGKEPQYKSAVQPSPVKAKVLPVDEIDLSFIHTEEFKQSYKSKQNKKLVTEQEWHDRMRRYASPPFVDQPPQVDQVYPGDVVTSKIDDQTLKQMWSIFRTGKNRGKRPKLKYEDFEPGLITREEYDKWIQTLESEDE